MPALTQGVMAFLAFMFLSVGAFAETREAPAAAAPAAEVGQPAPEFRAVDSNGKEHALSDYKGKTVVLEWTNHECPFVKKHYDSGNMQALQKEATGEGVIWLSVNSSAAGKEGHATPEQANALIAQAGSAATAYLIDDSGEIGMKYGAKTTPHMYVVDPGGVLVYAGAIDDQPTASADAIQGAKNFVREALGDLEAGRPVAVAQTQAYGCGVKYR